MEFKLGDRKMQRKKIKYIQIDIRIESQIDRKIGRQMDSKKDIQI